MHPVSPRSISSCVVQSSSDDDVDLDAILERELAGLDAPDEAPVPTLPVPDQGPMLQQREQLRQMMTIFVSNGLIEQCRVFKEDFGGFLRMLEQSNSMQMSQNSLSFPYPPENLGEEERILVLDLTKLDQEAISSFCKIKERIDQISEEEFAQLEHDMRTMLERFVYEGKAEILEKPKAQLSDGEKGKRLQLLREIGFEGHETASIAIHPHFFTQATIAFYSYLSEHQECISNFVEAFMKMTKPENLMNMLFGGKDVVLQYEILKSCLEEAQRQEVDAVYRNYFSQLLQVMK
jgi:hypothetical protein